MWNNLNYKDLLNNTNTSNNTEKNEKNEKNEKKNEKNEKNEKNKKNIIKTKLLEDLKELFPKKYTRTIMDKTSLLKHGSGYFLI